MGKCHSHVSCLTAWPAEPLPTWLLFPGSLMKILGNSTPKISVIFFLSYTLVELLVTTIGVSVVVLLLKDKEEGLEESKVATSLTNIGKGNNNIYLIFHYQVRWQISCRNDKSMF